MKTALTSSRLYYSTEEYVHPLRLGLNVTESIKSSEGGEQSEYEMLGHGGKMRCRVSSGDDARRVRPMREHFQDMKGGPRDALMELARENLILHQHLYLANVEVWSAPKLFQLDLLTKTSRQVLRLKGVVKDFEDGGGEVIVESKKQFMVSCWIASDPIIVLFDSTSRVNNNHSQDTGPQKNIWDFWMLFKRKDMIFSPSFYNQAKATFLCDNSIEHKDVKAIAQFVGTRNSTQVRTHAQKYFMKLVRDSFRIFQFLNALNLARGTACRTPFCCVRWA
jgi:hypothetical protein